LSYSDEAIAAAADVHLYDGEKIDRSETTLRIKTLLSQHDANIDVCVDTNVLTLDEITFEIFHVSLLDLERLVSQICGLSAQGPLQKSLNGDGFMLCGRRVMREYPDPGRPGMVSRSKKTARFLSKDPAVVREWLLEPRAGRLKNGVDGLKELHDLAEHRIPELAQSNLARRHLFLTEATQRLLPGVNP